MKKLFQVQALLIVAASCNPVEPTKSDIGMVQVQVHETTSALEIIGFDASSAQVAHLQLTVGLFYFNDQSRYVDGRQMDIDVLGKKTNHQSAGADTLSLPLFLNPEYQVFNSFLTDVRVEPVLARWGVTFKHLPAGVASSVEPVPAEVATGSCSFATTAQCGATSCAQSNEVQFFDTGCSYVGYQDVCCGSLHMAAQRACTSANSSSPCGPTGPNGCAICWQTSYSSSCSAWTANARPMRWCDDADGGIPFWPDNIQLSYN